jgi:hypothetical protein
MMIARTSRYLRVTFVAAVVLLATLACGCMWGVVRNANTGAPAAGASVTFWDKNGNQRTAATDANGIYYFDSSSAPPAALGDVTFFVTAPNSEARREMRPIDYAENPNASLSNMASFWEVQTFDVGGQPGTYHDVTQGYTIEFPADWYIEPQPEPGEGPLSSIVYAGAVVVDLEACTIQSSVLPPGGIPDNWWRDAPEDVTVTGRGTTQIAGRTATRVNLTYDEEVYGNVKAVMWVFERGQQAWIILCMGDDSAIRSRTFETIAKSFRFDS